MLVPQGSRVQVLDARGEQSGLTFRFMTHDSADRLMELLGRVLPVVVERHTKPVQHERWSPTSGRG